MGGPGSDVHTNHFHFSSCCQYSQAADNAQGLAAHLSPSHKHYTSTVETLKRDKLRRDAKLNFGIIVGEKYIWGILFENIMAMRENGWRGENNALKWLAQVWFEIKYFPSICQMSQFVYFGWFMLPVPALVPPPQLHTPRPGMVFNSLPFRWSNTENLSGYFL